MSKHTPGPWHIHKKQTESAFRIDAQGDEWQELATVYQVPPYTHLMEQGEANARLIAAAPDLLAIAKLILKEWEAPTDGVQRGELIARLSQYSIEARQAISKAEGGQV